MSLPIATIGLSLAAAGLKIFGSESKLLEFAAHPLDVAAGHLGAESILQLAERLRVWYAGNERIENQDLERAVTRSALLADLFCLLDALPLQPVGFGAWSVPRERFKKWLPENFLQGILSQAEQSVIHPAIEDRKQMLKELEKGAFIPTEIDPMRLVVPEQGADWSAKLSGDALEDLRREHAGLPNRIDAIFRERWFPYLCLAFQEQIKINPRVSAIFQAMQVATGFLNIEDVVREEHAETRRLIREIAPRSWHAPVDRYASVSAPIQNYVDRVDLQDRLRDLLLGSDQPIALTALHGMGGIGKTELARNLCHDTRVRAAFPDGIVWLDIGRESSKTVLDRMRELADKLNAAPAEYTVQNCEARYRTLLAGKAILVVMDDVWSTNDVTPFIPDSAGCRLLFTTRNAGIAAELGAADCTADTLRAPEALAVLAKCAGLDSDRLPPASSDIIAECGSLPLGLTVVGAALRGKQPARWIDILEKLQRAQVSKLLAPTAVSVDELGTLNPEARERYLQLAVLLEDIGAPGPVLQTLWGVDAMTVRDTVDELESRSLARQAEDGIRIHDLQMDYVRSVYPHKETLLLIHEALRLSSHVVELDGAQFSSQMVGRLLPYLEREGIREFVEQISAGAPRPWLRPLAPGLRPPGTGLIRTLAGHTGHVFGVAVSADGRLAASVGSDKTLKVWDVESGRERFEGYVNRACAVAVNGKMAISVSIDGTLKLWDVESGCERRMIQDRTIGFRGATFSADGKIVAVMSADGDLKIRDAESGQERCRLPSHADHICRFAVSGDGRIAISMSGGDLKVWDLVNGGESHTFRCRGMEIPGQRVRLSSVALAADGKVAVSTSGDDTLSVWDLAAGREAQTLKGQGPRISPVALSANGKMVLSASRNPTLEVWDLSSGRKIETFDTKQVNQVVVNADGRVAISSGYDGILEVWDLSDPRGRNTHRAHRDSVSSVAVSGDGKVAVSASGNEVKLWDVESGRASRTITVEGNAYSNLALSADRKVAISTLENHRLAIWDIEAGHRIHTLQGHADRINGIALSADGKVAISASNDKTLKVWDVESGRESRTLKRAGVSFLGVALSADGKIAASTSTDHALRVWDVDSGRVTKVFVGGRVRWPALSSDGNVVVAALWDELRIWNLENGGEPRLLHKGSSGICGASLSVSGKLLGLASFDHTLRVWNVESGTCVASFYCDGPTICCAFGGSVIAAGDSEGHVYFFTLEGERAASRGGQPRTAGWR